jgi:ribokinase
VDVSAVAGTRSHPTGVALIQVDRSGQNSIVVASGANFVFPASDVAGTRSSFQGARFALFQLETPLPAVEAALRLARSEGARTILDPAPAQSLPRSLLAAVDILTPNESEASILLGRSASRVGITDAPEMSRSLLALGPAAVILKLGENGCFYADATQQIHAPGFRVAAVDTTAAGDTFNAALAVALAEETPLQRALAFANAAAAISVTRAGAQASIPSRAETDQFLVEQA